MKKLYYNNQQQIVSIQAITSEVILSHTNATDGVVVRYFTRCLRPIGSPLTENRTCDGLGVGTTVDFTISIDTSLVNVINNQII